MGERFADLSDPAEAEAHVLEARVRQAVRAVNAQRRARQARLRLVAATIAAGWSFVLRDLAGLGGAALVSYGAWLAYAPAGYAVAGALLLAGAWLAGVKDVG